MRSETNYQIATASKLFRDLALFSLITILCLCVFELLAREIHPPRNQISDELAAFTKEEQNIEVLLTGNSQMRAAINCEIFSQFCFNASVNGQDPYYMSQAIEHKLESMSRLKVVALNLSLFSFGLDTASDTKYVAREYFSMYGILPAQNPIPSLMLAYSQFFLHRRTFFLDLWHGQIVGDSIKIYYPKARTQHEIAAHAARTHAILHGRIHQHNVQAIDNLLTLLRRRSVQVYILVLPSHPLYERAYPDSIKKNFYKAIRGLLAKHPKVHFVDYSKWSELGDADFADDSFHLRPKGAEKVSASFLRTVILQSHFSTER